MALYAVNNHCYAQYFKADSTDFYRDSGGIPIPEQEAFDVKMYDLKLSIEPENEWIGGSLEMTAILLKRLDVIALDLDPLLRVESIGLNHTLLDTTMWKHENGRIFIKTIGQIKTGLDFKAVI